jgi:hypothetical protein
LFWTVWTYSFTDEYWIVKRPIHPQLNWVILLCDVIPDGKTE